MFLKELAALAEGHCGEQAIIANELRLFGGTFDACDMRVTYVPQVGGTAYCVSGKVHFDDLRSPAEVWLRMQQQIIPAFLAGRRDRLAAREGYDAQWQANRKLLQELAAKAGMNPADFEPTWPQKDDHWSFELGDCLVSHIDDAGICFEIQCAESDIAHKIVDLLLADVAQKESAHVD